MNDNELTFDNLFKYSFVVSVNDKRYRWYKKVFKFFGLPAAEKVGKKVKGQKPEFNCGMNHIECVRLAKERNYPYCLIFEDDAYPRKDIIEKLNFYITEFNRQSAITCNTDVLYLGFYSLQSYGTIIAGLHNFSKVTRHWSSHAYIVFKKFYDKFLSLQKFTNYVTNIDSIWRYPKIICYRTSESLFDQYIKYANTTIHFKDKLESGYFFSECNQSMFNFNPDNYIKIQ